MLVGLIGSLFVLNGAHSLNTFSSPSIKSSSRSSLANFNVVHGAHLQHQFLSPILGLAVFGAWNFTLQYFIKNRMGLGVSVYRACLMRQRAKFQALFASESIIWAFLYTTLAAMQLNFCMQGQPKLPCDISQNAFGCKIFS